ncbi:uncharacterized protein PGTG_12468 [Puccinia graminis f. sp. tritici CRL 75-36-700-3]|uniref:Secreted protein n=2 Tax=Puccinia graminis f. sp. tritici TaxID=56615 RepID=E3KQD7_PUCGT|nr:uncharacterized protein PGTG_12468 [Puccinia graminis f. sp. tritici CRL 75-36-700-3]EFP86512.1 hypothetical protein PGTG_12468 [Puccinia graminis f. sp. tritici CRL 75-36-700-3]
MVPQAMSTFSLCVSFFFLSGVLAKEETGPVRDQDCSTYVNANSTSASCDDVWGMVCTGGCTGYVTATQCTTSHEMNDQRPPLTSEKCTVSYGKSSATMALCITPHQTFTCYGPTTGKARCKACNEPPRLIDNPPDKGSPGGSGNRNGGGSDNKPPAGDSPQADNKSNSPPSGNTSTPQGNSTTGNPNTPPATSGGGGLSPPTSGNNGSPNKGDSPKDSAATIPECNRFFWAFTLLLSSAFL